MADAALSAPLHLAASLLALVAAAGLAIIVLARPGTLRAEHQEPGRSERLLAAGAGLLVAGHIWAGVLIPGERVFVPLLHAAGLTLIAVGLSPPRLQGLAGPRLVVPLPLLVSVHVVGGVAGVVGGVRALLGGRATRLIGVGLLAWGAAQALQLASPTAAAWLTLAGAAAIGWWLWRVSAHALLAKFVTASVAILLAVIVLVATTLSGLDSRDLVISELERLSTISAGVADDVERDWPAEAVDAATAMATSEEPLLGAEANRSGLQDLYESVLEGQDQDFLVVLDARGRVRGSYAPDASLNAGFRRQVRNSPAVAELMTGGRLLAADLLRAGSRLVVLGAARLAPASARAEQVPIGAVVTGRVADRFWADEVSEERQSELLISLDGRASAVTQGLRNLAAPIAGALADDSGSSTLQIDGRSLYVASTPVRDLRSRQVVGRAVAVNTAATLEALQRAQVRRLFGLALLGGLLAGLVTAAVTRRLVAPIHRLTAAAEAVGGGDLDVHVGNPSRDEIGVLGRTFATMTTSLATQASQLRESAATQARLRSRLEALTTSMSDALVAVNPDGRIVTFNPAAQRLVGRDITDVLGLPLEDVLVGQGPDGKTAAAAVGPPDAEGEVAVQLLLTPNGGPVIPAAVTAAPVHDRSGERVLGRVLVLRDVSREVEVERMKTEFLANVSHELRTPLTPIKGYAEMLGRRQYEPEVTRRFAEAILVSSARLERIVGLLVDFAALDSGRQQLASHVVALPGLVAEVLAVWQANEPQRQFGQEMAPGLPTVLADPVMLCRALDELLDNAVKFSASGCPVRVTGDVSVVGGRSMVRLSVHDEGVGIEPDVAARIFGDFYQGDASETRSYGGLGLGLALVRRIAEGLGGKAAVRSELGLGSSFQLLLPVGRGDSA
ncbi:MAG: ATP-binding protein [Actinomycetota bacterium]|jgi:PAS domain S-box-containing protein|nr:ATP-binding protein [Actinomycetota bacterium]